MLRSSTSARTPPGSSSRSPPVRRFGPFTRSVLCSLSATRSSVSGSSVELKVAEAAERCRGVRADRTQTRRRLSRRDRHRPGPAEHERRPSSLPPSGARPAFRCVFSPPTRRVGSPTRERWPRRETSPRGLPSATWAADRPRSSWDRRPGSSTAARSRSGRCGCRGAFLDSDPPGRKAVAAARAEIEARFDGLSAPAAEAALATGGSARSLRKLTGERLLGEQELAAAVKAVARRTSSQIARETGLDPIRARTLLGRGPDPRRDPAPPGPAARGRPRRPARGRGSRAARTARRRLIRPDPAPAPVGDNDGHARRRALPLGAQGAARGNRAPRRRGRPGRRHCRTGLGGAPRAARRARLLGQRRCLRRLRLLAACGPDGVP